MIFECFEKTKKTNDHTILNHPNISDALQVIQYSTSGIPKLLLRTITLLRGSKGAPRSQR